MRLALTLGVGLGLGLVTARPASAQESAAFVMHRADGGERIVRVPVRGASSASLSASSLLTGAVRYIVIGCRYADIATTPFGTDVMSTLVGASYPGVDHYWQEVSGGALSLTGSGVSGWFNLPETEAYYNPNGQADPNRLYPDCLGAADAAVNFGNYDGAILLFNGNILTGTETGAFSSLGAQPIEVEGQVRSFRLVFIGAPVARSQFTWVHQMGHTFGLKHTTSQTGTVTSQWDAMSAGQFQEALIGDKVAVHPAMPQKDLQGWIPSGRILEAGIGSNTTVELSASSLASTTSGYLMIRVPLSGGSYLTVEARRAGGYDKVLAGALPGEGVVVHRINPFANPIGVVIDTDGNFNPNDAGGFLAVGESYSDPNGVTVSVLASVAGGYTVRICSGTQAGGQYGDVNGDGAINVIDAQQVARFSVGLAVTDPSKVNSLGDVNADGQVNVVDAQIIARHSVGLPVTSRIGQAATGGC